MGMCVCISCSANVKEYKQIIFFLKIGKYVIEFLRLNKHNLI